MLFQVQQRLIRLVHFLLVQLEVSFLLDSWFEQPYQNLHDSFFTLRKYLASLAHPRFFVQLLHFFQYKESLRIHQLDRK